MTVDAAERPVLTRIPAVELIHAGRWLISNGEWTVTSGDLYAAVAALDCPAVRRPILKLGHTDPRFDGEPAVGYVDAMAVSANGVQLVGDYAGIPGWLADVLASAYPDRSIEGEYDARCQIGHTHPFVVSAVALLGVTAPGVGTLESLQDIAAVYGVAASADDSPDRFTLPVTAKGEPMPTPVQVSAAASVEDVRHAFYDGPAANNWWWIEDLFLDPLEVVAIDDADGKLWRVPFTVTSSGEVTWSDAQEVRREYVAASVSVRSPVASWASKAESRPPQHSPSASTDPEVSINPGEEPAVAFSDEQLITLRQKLGTAEDADEATILAALDEALDERAEADPQGNTNQAELPEGTVAIDSDQLEELQVAARAGQEARVQQQRESRERLVSAAVSDGRIPPARREAWLTQIEADSGSADVLASLAPGLVPLAAIGHDGDIDAESDVRESDTYKNWRTA